VIMTGIPIADGLFSVEDAALVGSTCQDCEFIDFPRTTGCPRCGSDRLQDTLLHTTGTLWTWTSQEFRPVAPPYTGAEDPKAFQRYYVGFIELDGQTRVESRLVNVGPAGPQIGDQYRFTIQPFGPDADGNERLIYAFEPASGRSAPTTELPNG